MSWLLSRRRKHATRQGAASTWSQPSDPQLGLGLVLGSGLGLGLGPTSVIPGPGQASPEAGLEEQTSQQKASPTQSPRSSEGELPLSPRGSEGRLSLSPRGSEGRQKVTREAIEAMAARQRDAEAFKRQEKARAELQQAGTTQQLTPGTGGTSSALEGLSATVSSDVTTSSADGHVHYSVTVQTKHGSWALSVRYSDMEELVRDLAAEAPCKPLQPRPHPVHGAGDQDPSFAQKALHAQGRRPYGGAATGRGVWKGESMLRPGWCRPC